MNVNKMRSHLAKVQPPWRHPAADLAPGQSVTVSAQDAGYVHLDGSPIWGTVTFSRTYERTLIIDEAIDMEKLL